MGQTQYRLTDCFSQALMTLKLEISEISDICQKQLSHRDLHFHVTECTNEMRASIFLCLCVCVAVHLSTLSII